VVHKALTDGGQPGLQLRAEQEELEPAIGVAGCCQAPGRLERDGFPHARGSGRHRIADRVAKCFETRGGARLVHAGPFLRAVTAAMWSGPPEGMLRPTAIRPVGSSRPMR